MDASTLTDINTTKGRKMNKQQRIILDRAVSQASTNPGFSARTISALIRSSLSDKAKRELLAKASESPAIVSHPDFRI